MELIADFLSAIGDPWDSEFMRRALIASLIVSVVSAVVGSFVVLKGMAFISDALPHVSFGGVAVAFVLGANLELGGAVAALLAALVIGFITRRGFVRQDTAIGVVFVAGFALGVLLVSRQSSYTVDLFSFVFGNILGISWEDVWTIAAMATGVLLVVTLFYKELLFVAYDPAMAAATGVPVGAMHYGLLVLVGLAVVIALQVVGVVLVPALLVVPAATAQLLVHRLPAMMALGALVGGLSSVLGLYIAWYGDVSASAAIVLVAASFFLIAFLFSPGRGLVSSLRTARASANNPF